MERGKKICETLKGIRREIAEANDIDYTPTPCSHEGDCAGTCPKCESETRWLEGQLRLRQSLGKAVTIAGLSLGAASLISCNSCSKPIHTVGIVENPNRPVMVADSDSIDLGEELMGDVCVEPDSATISPPAEPQEIDGVTQPEDPYDNRPPK